MGVVWGALGIEIARSARVNDLAPPDGLFSHSKEKSRNNIQVVGGLDLHRREDLVRSLNCVDKTQLEDWELVIESYLRWGLGCLSHIEGEFRFALWDPLIRRLILATDHFASLPLCYWHKRSQFVFASNPLLLFEIANIPRELNRRKLANMQMLGGQDFHPEETMHAGIQSLPPASYLMFAHGDVSTRCYWRPGEEAATTVPKREEEAFELLKSLLFESVANHLGSSRRITSTLSGGLIRQP